MLDTDGFVIPSLGIGDLGESKPGAAEEKVSEPLSSKVSCALYIFKMIIFRQRSLYHEVFIILALDQILHLFIPHVQGKKEENIYLGPHGAPPSQSKQQDLSLSSRKQRFKQKLKEADRKSGGTGRENKVETLRELVGAGKVGINMSKGTSKDWLDQHCHESQFEKWNPQ